MLRLLSFVLHLQRCKQFLNFCPYVLQRCIIRFEPWKAGYSTFPILVNKRKAPFPSLAAFVFASVGIATLHYILFRSQRTYVCSPAKTQTSHIPFAETEAVHCHKLKKESITSFHPHDTPKISHYTSVTSRYRTVTSALQCNGVCKEIHYHTHSADS